MGRKPKFNPPKEIKPRECKYCGALILPLYNYKYDYCRNAECQKLAKIKRVNDKKETDLKSKISDKQKLFQSQKLFPGLESHLVQEARRAKKHKPGKIVPFRMLWESARYELCFKRRRDEYALNNNTQGLWARYLMDKYEDLKGLFETRGE